MGVSEKATVRVSVGTSESFDTVEAAGEAAARSRAGLEAPCDLAVVFASGQHLGMAKWLLSEVHERLEPRALIGCGAGGILGAGREMEEGPGVVVWGASLPGAEVETMHLTAQREADGFRLLGLPQHLFGLTGDGDPAAPDECLIALCDPFSFPAEELLAVTDRSRPGTPVLGGLASASFAGGAVLMQDGDVHADGAVGVHIRGVQVLPCVSQGAGPVGPEMTITQAEANVIGELAGKPAMERLGEVISSLPDRERELAASGVLIGLVIDENRPEYGRGDFLVRPIIGADRESGAIAVGEPVRVGQTVRLQVRDAASADEDLREVLAAQARALGPSGVAGALLFTCNGRGSHMFDVPDHDAAAIEDSLGVPAAGFFCAGEIGPVGGSNFLHGFTATMAVFPS
jgi:small ligand-binding sensory domain FIST